MATGADAASPVTHIKSPGLPIRVKDVKPEQLLGVQAQVIEVKKEDDEPEAFEDSDTDSEHVDASKPQKPRVSERKRMQYAAFDAWYVQTQYKRSCGL